MNKTIILLLLMLPLHLFSEEITPPKKSLIWSLSNNNTALPVSGYPSLFYANFHPGLDISYCVKLKENKKNAYFINYQLNGIYHRFVQTLTTFTTGLTYSHKLHRNIHLSIGGALGLGTSFSNTSVAKINESGEYITQPVLKARLQFIGTIQPRISFPVSRNKSAMHWVHLSFRTQMQGVFVKSYVPLLPVNGFLIGYSHPILRSK
jgi:hypothetical protein